MPIHTWTRFGSHMLLLSPLPTQRSFCSQFQDRASSCCLRLKDVSIILGYHYKSGEFNSRYFLCFSCYTLFEDIQAFVSTSYASGAYKEANIDLLSTSDNKGSTTTWTPWIMAKIRQRNGMPSSFSHHGLWIPERSQPGQGRWNMQLVPSKSDFPELAKEWLVLSVMDYSRSRLWQICSLQGPYWQPPVWPWI